MRVVLCSCPPDEALVLARTVVEERLAASVQITPGVTSVYRWKGEMCEEAESVLVLKTPIERVEALRARIREVHPYEVPDITVLPVDREETDPQFLAWVRALATAG